MTSTEYHEKYWSRSSASWKPHTRMSLHNPIDGPLHEKIAANYTHGQATNDSTNSAHTLAYAERGSCTSACDR